LGTRLRRVSRWVRAADRAAGNACGIAGRCDGNRRLRKLQSWISGIVPEGSRDETTLPKKKKDILRLLRHVQDERTKRAARYVEQKKLAAGQGAGSERRMSSPESIVEEGPPKPKRNYLPILLAIAVLIAVGAYFLT
jgi:hypothetical protein